MNALESEIMEKFHQLPPAAKQRIRALIDRETTIEVEQLDASSFDYAAWFQEVEVLHKQIRSTQLPPIDVVGILRDIRNDDDV
jgi:hypothetical protein